MELALYAPASGFFATDGSAGRRGGDFITSVEVGPLFGALVAARLDRLWEDLGRPSPFTVLEAGAGRGALAIAVRAAGPRCADVLHWVLVERSAALRARHPDHLRLSERRIGDAPGGDGPGPWFGSRADLPREPFRGAVVANELLDNLPFRLMQRRDGRWAEVHVVAGSGPDAPPVREELVDTAMAEGGLLDQLAPDAPEGARVPWQREAASWVGRATSLLRGGLVLAFDYSRSTAEMAALPQSEWLRTYRAHDRGGDPLDAPGTRDITVDVASDQLPSPHRVASQADWLRAAGIDGLVAEAAERWEQEAATGGLDAVRARSVAVEAAALCDPSGLGGFSVFEWDASP